MYQKVGGFKNQNYLLMGTSREDKVQNQQNCNGFRGPLVMQQLLFQGFTTHALVLRGRERVDPTHSHASEKTSWTQETSPWVSMFRGESHFHFSTEGLRTGKLWFAFLKTQSRPMRASWLLRLIRVTYKLGVTPSAAVTDSGLSWNRHGEENLSVRGMTDIFSCAHFFFRKESEGDKNTDACPSSWHILLKYNISYIKPRKDTLDNEWEACTHLQTL